MPTWSELVASLAAVYVVYEWLAFRRVQRKLAHIPTMGSDWFILSYLNAWRFAFKGHLMIAEGYEKYGRKPFKVPTLTTSSRWLVIVSGLDMVEELRMAPSEVLSFRGASNELFQQDRLMKPHPQTTPFHIPIIRNQFTKGFPARFAEILDEARCASLDFLRESQEDWTPVKLHDAMVHIVSRTSNRFFLGSRFCRTPEYIETQEKWPLHIILSSVLLQITPEILRTPLDLLMHALPVHRAKWKTERVLEPIISERLEKMKIYGDKWEDKPNDLITWLIEGAPPENRNVRDISIKVMVVNFSSIHTTTATLSTTLLNLAAWQEYLAPIRAEIEQCIAEHGWTREATVRMRKLDSFIKESMRIPAPSSVAMRRRAIKDFTFSNGFVIPAGVSVAVASRSMQLDPEYYEDPLTFRGFRFSETSETRDAGSSEFSEESVKNQLVSLDPTYMLFGYGRHSCPGRFFATNEIKVILSHILLTYDLKLPGDATEPPKGIWFSGNTAPNTSAQILLRRRRRV